MNFLPSCTKEDEMEVEESIMEERRDTTIHIGDYRLLPESLDRIPYLGKEQIVFVDSSNNSIVLEIEERDLFVSNSATLFRYDVFEEGDTVKYTHTRESKYFIITNDSLSLSFSLSLSSRPYYPDPESRAVADVLNIFLRDSIDATRSSQVFYHLTNPRSYPNPSLNPPVENVEIWGRIFDEVLMHDFQNPKSIIQFNYEFGMVSFTDFSGKLWRFDSMN